MGRFTTQERRLYTICRSLCEIREAGFKLESPYSLRRKHLECLVRTWVRLGQTGGTIENKLSHLKALCQWMGKHDVVQSLEMYVDKDALGLKRSYVTTVDKSWEAHGVDPVAKIAQIAEEHPRVAVQMKLQAAFGLRIEESFSLKIRSALLNLDTLQVVDGTKGGKKRVVPLQLQLDVLREAAALVDPVSGSTTPANYSIARWRHHYYGGMRKYGVFKKGEGITSHGLRHGWMQAYYKLLSGVDAPVKGGIPQDLEAHRQAILEVVEAAGHSRPRKSGAYLSTVRSMRNAQRPTVTLADARRAVLAHRGNKATAAQQLGISRQALYRLMAQGA